MGSGMSVFKVKLNGKDFEIGSGTTLSRLLETIGIKPQGIAVELNLEVVPKSKYKETPLRDGDRIEIVRMVGGG